MAAVDGLAFVIVAAAGFVVLGEIDRASQSMREIESSTRVASLTPRRSRSYLPWTIRCLPVTAVAIGLSWLGWRLATPVPHRQLWLPLVFGLGALVFVVLYETWIHSLVTGPVAAVDRAGGSHDRSWARWIAAAELVLVIVCMATSHALLDLNWRDHGAAGAAIALIGGVFGVAGCALALASDLNRRRYAQAQRAG
jgi:hypothetical protein